jgi:hypothetical protein
MYTNKYKGYIVITNEIKGKREVPKSSLEGWRITTMLRPRLNDRRVPTNARRQAIPARRDRQARLPRLV